MEEFLKTDYLKVQNVVSTFSIGTCINLRQIALKARNVEYNPKRFAAAIMRIRNPRTTALIFSTGKLVVTGAKTEKESYTACRRFARIMQKLGHVVNFNCFKIQNIVASFAFIKKIKLDVLAVCHSRFCSYEPELFPGVHYRFYLSGAMKMVLLIFASGKVVITGAKNINHIEKAARDIIPVLDAYSR